MQEMDSVGLTPPFSGSATHEKKDLPVDIQSMHAKHARSSKRLLTHSQRTVPLLHRRYALSQQPLAATRDLTHAATVPFTPPQRVPPLEPAGAGAVWCAPQSPGSPRHTLVYTGLCGAELGGTAEDQKWVEPPC